MKILVRLPNWLGDMVMAVGAVQQIPVLFPGAEVSVIAKKGIHDLLDYFPPLEHRFVFSKEEYSGVKGLWRFGRSIRETEKFDLFISFPDSFSSALMGFATGAPKRTGYKKEGRNMLLTQSFTREKGLHRVEEYVRLLEMYSGRERDGLGVRLQHSYLKEDHLVININSEASSRRLTVSKAVEVITGARKTFPHHLVLIGGQREAAFVEEVFSQLPVKDNITSIAGRTSLLELGKVLASAQLMLTTDSGPAHLANALGTQTVVLFGAGNENNTAPYNKELLEVIRLGKLNCEPCTKNVCVQFGTPQCLELLETEVILSAMKQKMRQVC
jgi:heptosyltransferase II